MANEPATASTGDPATGTPLTGKLVRDNIPQIIRASGAEPVTYTASAAEYAARLRNKLCEETSEYLAEGEWAELADILEVLYALAALSGITPQQLEALRTVKAAERGTFTTRTIWTGNQPPASPHMAA